MSNKVKLNIYAFVTVFLWASAFPLTKIACQQFSPNALALIRCSLAAIFLIIIGKINHVRKPFRKKDIFLFTASGGMAFTIYMVFFNTGMLTLTSATSSIIIASSPIMTAIGASILYKEKIKPLGWISICMAFVGVVILLLWNGILSINIGVIWTLVSALAFCGYNLLNRKLCSIGYTSLEIAVYSMICGAALLLLFIPQAIEALPNVTADGILIVFYLALFPSALSYILWGRALVLAKKTNEVTNYMFLTPLLSTVMGFAILHEVPDLGTFIGGIIIIASLIMFSMCKESEDTL